MKKSDIDINNLNLLDHIPNPVMLLNPDTSIEYVNPALEDLTGLHHRNLSGRRYPIHTGRRLMNVNTLKN